MSKKKAWDTIQQERRAAKDRQRQRSGGREQQTGFTFEAIKADMRERKRLAREDREDGERINEIIHFCLDRAIINAYRYHGSCVVLEWNDFDSSLLSDRAINEIREWSQRSDNDFMTEFDPDTFKLTLRYYGFEVNPALERRIRRLLHDPKLLDLPLTQDKPKAEAA